MPVDTSELRAIAEGMDTGTARRRALVAATVKKGAQNVKEAIKADLKKSNEAPFRRINIHYDMQTVGANGIAADIGPSEGGAGDLANIAFFGAGSGGGTHEFYGHATDELDNFAEHIARIGQEGVFV